GLVHVRDGVDHELVDALSDAALPAGHGGDVVAHRAGAFAFGNSGVTAREEFRSGALRRVLTHAIRPFGSARDLLQDEAVLVGGRLGIGADRESVRARAVGRNPGDLGERGAFVERELDRPRVELGVSAAIALRDGEPVVDVELLAGGHIGDPQLEYQLVDVPTGRAGVLLRRRGNRPDGAIRRLHGTTVAPQ